MGTTVPGAARGAATRLTAGPPREPLKTIAREWARIGCTGFGGPPAHIALLRALCVDRRQWPSAQEFEDGVATTNLLPGPASTQLAIYCAWRLRGTRGALVGGACFIVPGLIVILARGRRPLRVRRVPRHCSPAAAGSAAAPRRRGGARGRAAVGGVVAVKAGALSYGGGFVIIPLMQHDAVHTYHWMTSAQFLSALALGQITPGPVVQTVAVAGSALGVIAVLAGAPAG